MAIVDKTTLKSYFETGDIPTESQYIDLIDSTFGSTRIENVATTTFFDTNLASYSNQAVVGSSLAGTNIIFTAQSDTGGTPADVFQIDGNGDLWNNSTVLYHADTSGNIVVGTQVSIPNFSSTRNTILGTNAGASMTNDKENVIIGAYAGNDLTGAFSSVMVGAYAGLDTTNADFNTFIGTSAGRQNNGSYNTSIGYSSGWVGDGSNCVFLGAYAGRYNTDSNTFLLDNQDRTNAANELTKSLMYGVFNAVPSSQTLRINAEVTINQSNRNLVLDSDAANSEIFFQSAAADVWRIGLVTATDFRIRNENTGTDTVLIDYTTNDATFVNDVYADDFILSSGIKFKENVKTLDGNIEGLRPIEYNIKGKKHKQYGFIAEEVQKTHPDLVRENKNGLAVSYISMIALMAEEIAQLKRKLK